jgi:hypothetical protein
MRLLLYKNNEAPALPKMIRLLLYQNDAAPALPK